MFLQGKREILAILTVDEDFAEAYAETNGFSYDGPIDYIERESGWIESSGIRVSNALIIDDDDADECARYLTYLGNWIFDHQDLTPQSPMTYDDWHKSCTKAQFCDEEKVARMIVEMFENYLNRHHVTIPGEFHESYDGETQFVGGAYHELLEKITNILKRQNDLSKHRQPITLEDFLKGSEAWRRNAENR